MRRWVDEGRDVFVYYNNDRGGNALVDGSRLKASMTGALLLGDVA